MIPLTQSLQPTQSNQSQTMNHVDLSSLSVCTVDTEINLPFVLDRARILLLECMEGEPTLEKSNTFEQIVNKEIGEFLFCFCSYILEPERVNKSLMTWSNEERQELKDLLCCDIQNLLNQAIIDATIRPKHHFMNFAKFPLRVNECILLADVEIQIKRTELQSIITASDIRQKRSKESLLSMWENFLAVFVRMDENRKCAEAFDLNGSCFAQAASPAALYNVMEIQ